MLAQITREAQVRKVEAGGGGVLFHAGAGKMVRDVGGSGGDERLHGAGFAGGAAHYIGSQIFPVVETFAELRDVFGGIFRRAEMREKKLPGFARENGRERRIPKGEIDIGRGRGRHNVGTVHDANPRGVADESEAVGVIEVADVVRSVAGGVDDVELAFAEGNGFAAFEDAEIFLRDGERVAEEAREIVSPKAAGAGEKFRGIGQVRRAELVDVNLEAGIFADECAGGAGMVQVNVRDEDGVEIGDGEAVGAKLLAQSCDG